MAKLQYPSIIETSEKFTALADLGKRLNRLDKSQIMTSFVDLVPVEFLELLAEKWSVTGYDGWLLAESTEAKRKLIKRAVELHRYKGTPWAMREIIRQLGFGEVLIDEGGLKKHNGLIRLRNGFHRRGSTSNWAEYQLIFLTTPVSKSKAKIIALAVQQYAPARCFLSGLVNQKNLIKHNGRLTIRNGEFNRGERWSVRQKIQ